MSPRSVDQRLEDMLAAIAAIAQAEARLDAAGIGRDERVRVSAVVRELAIIGEAASTLPSHVTDREPGIPWRNIAGIRILLDHHYHRVDADVLWPTVDRDLEPLRDAVQRLLERES